MISKHDRRRAADEAVKSQLILGIRLQTPNEFRRRWRDVAGATWRARKKFKSFKEENVE